MKYTLKLNIDLPRDRVVEQFDDPRNWTEWQESLIGYEPISGAPGQPGAWNRVSYRFSSPTPAVTGWEFETEFKCSGLLKLMSLLMPGMFRKASLRDMQDFKRFAETAASKAADPD